MRIAFTAALLAVSVAAAAHEAPVSGYWGDNTDSKIWHNSYGECWQTGTITSEQATLGCEPKPVVVAPKAAPAPVAPVAVAPPPPPAPVVVAAPVDTDGDGVVDSKDTCPDSRKGAKVDENGCYIVLKETVTMAINVKFPTGSSRMHAEDEAEVQKMADFMNQYPQTTVEIGGHTDNTGNAKTNTTLSQARADAVRKVLVDKFKIDGGRVTAKGYGSSKPVADNGTKEGRDANRRVEGVVNQTVEKVQQ